MGIKIVDQVLLSLKSRLPKYVLQDMKKIKAMYLLLQVTELRKLFIMMHKN